MAKQYWNSEATGRSRSVLDSLPKGMNFVLIGGWAVYSYVRTQKSEDVDLAIDPDRLDFFRKYGINDYDGINIKYSTINGAIIDLFINGYADKDLPVPVRIILSNYTLVDGMRVVNKELLLLLKLWGYFREDQTKVKKDMIDVLSLVFYGNLDFRKFVKYRNDYKVSGRRSSDALLEYLDKSENLWEYISPSKNEFDSLKEKYKKELRKLFGYPGI